MKKALLISLTVLAIGQLLCLPWADAWSFSKEKEYKIINVPTRQIEIIFDNDYQLLKAIYNTFPSKKRKLAKLNVFISAVDINGSCSINSDASLQLTSPPDRGIWLHELAHYFSNQLDSSDANEFAHEVIEQVADGMSADTYKKNFYYKKFGIYQGK